jgi:hypothetical protein
MTVPDDRIHDGGFASGPVRAEGKHSRCILTINGGSSSLKFAVFVAANSIERLLSGRVERIGRGESRLVVSDAGGSRREDCAVEAPNQAAAAALVIERVGVPAPSVRNPAVACCTQC